MQGRVGTGGTVLQGLLNERRVTQVELARRSGISRRTITSVCKGAGAAPETIDALAEALEVDALHLAIPRLNRQKVPGVANTEKWRCGAPGCRFSALRQCGGVRGFCAGCRQLFLVPTAPLRDFGIETTHQQRHYLTLDEVDEYCARLRRHPTEIWGMDWLLPEDRIEQVAS